jgi:hypothetical protein
MGLRGVFVPICKVGAVTIRITGLNRTLEWDNVNQNVFEVLCAEQTTGLQRWLTYFWTVPYSE